VPARTSGAGARFLRTGDCPGCTNEHAFSATHSYFHSNRDPGLYTDSDANSSACTPHRAADRDTHAYYNSNSQRARTDEYSHRQTHPYPNRYRPDHAGGHCHRHHHSHRHHHCHFDAYVYAAYRNTHHHPTRGRRGHSQSHADRDIATDRDTNHGLARGRRGDRHSDADRDLLSNDNDNANGDSYHRPYPHADRRYRGGANTSATPAARSGDRSGEPPADPGGRRSADALGRTNSL
jgi:hypothetical protein